MNEWMNRQLDERWMARNEKWRDEWMNRQMDERMDDQEWMKR